MPFNTLSVGVAVTPTVISTLLTHYSNRKKHRSKPTARISYHEGLHIIRQFLFYSSLHTVENLQVFTSQSVPSPRWVKVDKLRVPEDHLASAADLIIIQLGSEGLSQVGGNKWWRWRGKNSSLEGEWVEMQCDFVERQRKGVRSNRVMLYIHGGAYYFGSPNSHRYQIQRHARKLKARVFVRGWNRTVVSDSSLYLLPTITNVPASILVTLRDQRMPLPAGAILMSPWVDLTHSFPSVSGDGHGDYVPSYGFIHRPSLSWPPPNTDEIETIMKAEETRVNGGSRTSSSVHGHDKSTKAARRSFRGGTSLTHSKETSVGHRSDTSSIYEPREIFHNRNRTLNVEVDGQLVELKDQIHMYTTNELLSHPLVSPVLQPSLGGLPPMLILTGGAELLRDEQIYLAHKAADPACFLPSEEYLDRHDPSRRTVNKFPPTFVQLQVWDDLCHVAPTLSFTRPAKYMFRSVAQFGAWSLARAQQASIDIPYYASEVSSSDVDGPHTSAQKSATPSPYSGLMVIGKAGDPLPQFEDYMIRQRVDGDGNIYPLAARSHFAALQMLPEEIGVPKPGPVLKWLRAKEEWDTKFAKQKSAVQRQRLQEIQQGVGVFRYGEYPPPSSLASRKDISVAYEEEEYKKSHGMWLWSLIASKHDTAALSKAQTVGEADIRVGPQPSLHKLPSRRYSLRNQVLPHVKRKHRHSHQERTVSDLGQASESMPVLEPPPRSRKRCDPQFTSSGCDTTTPNQLPPEEFQLGLLAGPQFLNHDGRRPSSIYTDDAVMRSIKDADGVISPLFSRSRPDGEFKTQCETPSVGTNPDPFTPEQNDMQSTSDLSGVERNEKTTPVDDQLPVKEDTELRGDASEDTTQGCNSGKLKKLKYDFEFDE
ncbi:lipase/esterase [Histoplasma capsulatum var. duboisii H88]|uniref:Lipase/esterase n=1 Tax=Ajellomyces capsulatus (strain H88) TaxID=544711 RepID=F0UU04_AJEC8|nr:lipase/esterase [Histoplasma capsulatum var. duboisii H88]